MSSPRGARTQGREVAAAARSVKGTEGTGPRHGHPPQLCGLPVLSRPRGAISRAPRPACWAVRRPTDPLSVRGGGPRPGLEGFMSALPVVLRLAREGVPGESLWAPAP